MRAAPDGCLPVANSYRLYRPYRLYRLQVLARYMDDRVYHHLAPSPVGLAERDALAVPQEPRPQRVAGVRVVFAQVSDAQRHGELSAVAA
jgi:hypothetical protein